MSFCTFIASDCPLPEAAPTKEYPLHINLDEGKIYDGGADDNFFLKSFADVECYTDKRYGVSLEWHYTEGRAKRIIAYIKKALQGTDCVELWRVWLMDYCDFEDSPVIHRVTVSAEDLAPEDIKELIDAKVWNTPDKMHPGRPSFYCLTIKR